MSDYSKLYGTVKTSLYGNGEDHWTMKHNVYAPNSDAPTMGDLMRHNAGDMLKMIEANDNGHSTPGAEQKNFLAGGGQVETTMSPPTWLGSQDTAMNKGGEVPPMASSWSGGGCVERGNWSDGDKSGSWTERLNK